MSAGGSPQGAGFRVAVGRARTRATRWITTGRGRFGGALSRLTATVVSAVGLVMALVAGTGMALASANAPNPLLPVNGSSVQHADGSVTVTVGGRWSWDELASSATDGYAKSSPQLQCAQRYGIGWAVDWWGTTAPTAAPGFTVVNDAYQLSGNGSTPQNPPVAGSPAFSGPIEVQPVGGVTLQPANQVFWVGGATGNGPGHYAGGTSAVYDGFDAPLCPPLGQTGSDGAPVGVWSARATYPSPADVPKVLCVNFYDMHQKEGVAPKTGGSDWSPAKDGDNSIQTNDYNPNIGGNCFAAPPITTAAPATPQPPTLSVTKANDADGSGYHQSGTSTGPGEDVPFRVTVTNTSSVTEVIESISDSYSGRTIAPTCTGTTAQFVGSTVAPGATATCDFTIAGYAPAAGQYLTDQVTVTVHSEQNPTQTASGAASSTVTTPPASQTVAGAIMACGANGAPTSTLVQGGSLSVLSGSDTTATANNQLPATAVPAGDYTLSATAPAGYRLVSCGQPGVTVGSPATTATQPVTVPAGGAGAGTFYVAPASGPQTVAGSILACSGTMPTTTQVQGGSLTVLSGSNALATGNNQLPATLVPAGDYTLSATAPPGYRFVACGQPGVTIGSPATTATQPVAVPAGGSGAGTFYVAPVSGPQTIAGSILACTGTMPTTTQVAGGTLTVLSGADDLLAADNQLSPTEVPAGSYTLSATAPAGYRFVACGQPGVTIGSPATTATQPVTVPAGGSGVGTFYVEPVPIAVLGTQEARPAATPAPAPAPAAQSPAAATMPLALTAPPTPAPVAATAAPAKLAFTGAPGGLRWVLAVGLLLASAGCFILWATRPRELAAVEVEQR